MKWNTLFYDLKYHVSFCFWFMKIYSKGVNDNWTEVNKRTYAKKRKREMDCIFHDFDIAVAYEKFSNLVVIMASMYWSCFVNDGIESEKWKKRKEK